MLLPLAVTAGANASMAKGVEALCVGGGGAEDAAALDDCSCCG